MAEGNFQEHIKAEIHELQQRLEAKKKELGESNLAHEREIFKEVFQERFDELNRAIQSAAPSPISTQPPVSSALRDDSVKDLKKEEDVERLVYIAFEKGTAEALKNARAMGDYWIDELHDRLADEYYEKLLEFQRVEKL